MITTHENTIADGQVVRIRGDFENQGSRIEFEKQPGQWVATAWTVDDVYGDPDVALEVVEDSVAMLRDLKTLLT